jgi:hypothetical protein
LPFDIAKCVSRGPAHPEEVKSEKSTVSWSFSPTFPLFG